MARIRTIKPEFFTSEDIVGLSPFARLLFIATWCEADREGRLPWKTKTLKLRYFPGDSFDFDACARELVASRLVVLYGDGLAYIPTFAKHQHLNPRESASILPEPDASSRVSDAYLRVTDAQGGREGKGREGVDSASVDATPSAKPKKAAAKTSLPADFGISDRVRAWAVSKGFGMLETRLEHFVGACRAKGYTYADWDAAFMNAIRDDWAKLKPNGAANEPALLPRLQA